VKEKISIDIKVNDRNKNNNNNHIERITFLKNLFENKNLLSHFKICPSKIGSNYKAIANYLGSYSKNDIEKLALIFLWISDNVAYDTDKYFGAKKGANNTKKYDSPSEEVFQEGKAMCGGYATLFKSMCIEVGIKAEEISGYAKGFGYKYGEPYKRNHAWNAVYYEGKWNLIESTWGSGSCNDQHKFVKEFKPFYFMAPPQIMINTHFPEDPKWQLLNTPMKFDEFGKNERKDYSNFYNTIYKEKIDYLSHDFPDIANEGNKLQIKIKLDKKFLINLNITEKNKEPVLMPKFLSNIEYNNNGFTTFNLLFDSNGNYTFDIYNRDKNSTKNTFDHLLKYNINVKKANKLETNEGFPIKMYDEMSNLIEPKSYFLKIGSKINIKYKCEEAKKVAFINNGKWTYLEKK